MQLTISAAAGLLLISGAIALPEPRRGFYDVDNDEVAINDLGPVAKPAAEDISNCYILGTNRYPYLTDLIDCICNCGGKECADPNVGEISIDLQYDRILPDACPNAITKVLQGTSSSGEEITMADVFNGEGEDDDGNDAVITARSNRSRYARKVQEEDDDIASGDILNNADISDDGGWLQKE